MQAVYIIQEKSHDGVLNVDDDIFTKMMYGNMDSFIRKLKEMGYQYVRLISTTDGMFMTKEEAQRLMLTGSALLVGRK